MLSVCFCTDDKISYASLIFFSLYAEIDTNEKGHVRSRSIAIFKIWWDYHESSYHGVQELIWSTAVDF